MLEHWIVVLISFGALLIHDFRRREKSARNDRITYGIVLGIAAYLGIDYLAEIKLPFVNELLNLVFGPAGRTILESLRANGG